MAEGIARYLPMLRGVADLLCQGAVFDLLLPMSAGRDAAACEASGRKKVGGAARGEDVMAWLALGIAACWLIAAMTEEDE